MEPHDAGRASAGRATWSAGEGALLSDLRHLYGANTHLHTALTLMAAGPHTPAVSHLLAWARREASTQRWRLERLFEYLDEDIGRRHCSGMARILAGWDTATGVHRRQASLAATVSLAAHYLSTAYAAAAARARALGYPAVAAQLDQCVADAASLGRACQPHQTVTDRVAPASTESADDDANAVTRGQRHPPGDCSSPDPAR
jgi:ferritin-like metal-binding protein YciE